MSVVSTAPVGVRAEPAPVRRRLRGLPGLRGTGWLGHACFAVIALAALTAVLGPYVRPYPPDESNLSLSFVGSYGGHLLGFDSQGRDLLSRLLVGARSSMLGPLAVVVLSLAAGLLLAVVAAWCGSWVDSCISAATDVLFAFPAILLAVLTAAVFGPSQWAAAVAIAVAYTPYVARVIRAEAMRERAKPYVAALEVQGLSAVRICARHIVVNVAQMLVAECTILFGWAMLDLAAISFLGLGVQPPQADWGVMVAGGESGVLQGYPAESLYAGLAIVVVVVAFNILGERLNDRYVARLRS